MLIFILELFLVNDEAAQKTILSRRCFWASTFMTLTTEIIKWLYESKGYDSLFILRFNINQKSYRCLATCFCSFLINVKEIVIAYSPSCQSKPVRCYFLVFLVSFYQCFIISSFSPLFVHPRLFSSLFPLVTCAAFSALLQVNILVVNINIPFQNDYILFRHRSAHCTWTEMWKLIHSFTEWKWHCWLVFILLIPYSRCPYLSKRLC